MTDCKDTAVTLRIYVVIVIIFEIYLLFSHSGKYLFVFIDFSALRMIHIILFIICELKLIVLLVPEMLIYSLCNFCIIQNTIFIRSKFVSKQDARVSISIVLLSHRRLQQSKIEIVNAI